MQETEEMRVQSLGREDPLEEGMATHSSILAWRIPWTEEPGGLQSIRSQRVAHDWSDLAGTHMQSSNSNQLWKPKDSAEALHEGWGTAEGGIRQYSKLLRIYYSNKTMKNGRNP